MCVLMRNFLADFFFFYYFFFLCADYNADMMISEMHTHIGHTLMSGGNVLIPSFPCGVILDLVEPLHSYLHNNGLGYVPIYFVSPCSEYVIQYTNIIAEW